MKVWIEKYGKTVLLIAAWLIPILALWTLIEQTAYCNGEEQALNLLPTALFIVAEALVCAMLCELTNVKYVLGGISKGLAIGFPLILYFCVEWLCYGSFTAACRMMFHSHFYMMWFILALLTAIFWFLNMLWRRYWISATVMSAVLVIMGYINIAKIGINGDPFLPTDLYFASDLGDLTGFAAGALPFTIELVIVVVLLAAVIVLMALGQGKSIKCWWGRILLALLCAAFVGVTVTFPVIKDAIFASDDIIMSRQYRQLKVYNEHGFLGGFVINIEGYTPPPEGYDRENIGAIMQAHSTTTEGEFVQPDVIVYLGESVFDFTSVNGVTFTEDPTPVLHELLKNNVSGTMLQSSGVGGGTVRSEFEVLTGINLVDMKEGLIPYNTFVPQSSEQVYGLPNYFKGLGYKTVGIHSFDRTFYSRDICYSKMGFDEFIGQQDLDAEISKSEDLTDPNVFAKYYDVNSKRQFMYDSYFVECIARKLEEDETPKFIFAISMENHGQFTEKYPDPDIVAIHPNWDEKETGIANCYVKSVKAADAALGELYEYIQKRERPTVVLFFGDHLPTLNDKHTVLEKTGFISTGESSDWTEQDMYNMYRTPFVIFSNFSTETAQLGDYSSYMLAPVLLDYMNAPSNNYWNLISDMHKQVPVYNRFVVVDKEGNVALTKDEHGNSNVQKLDAAAQKAIEEHTLISYDALAGERYINDLLIKK